MSNPIDDRRKALEEEYFRRKEQEALQKLRAQMGSETGTGESAATKAIGCPKCEGTLVEVGFENVQIDRCDTCGGVWLDAGELETITARESSGWFNRMRQNLVREQKTD